MRADDDGGTGERERERGGASRSRRVRGGEHGGDAKKRETTEAPMRGRGAGQRDSNSVQNPNKKVPK